MKKPYIIGIAGGSGAGKTFLLKKLREHLDENSLCIISQDNYYRPAYEQLLDENGQINFDRPEGIDDEAFLKDIDALSNNQPVTRQEYMFNKPGVTGQLIELKPAPVMVIEGLFIFHFPEIKKRTGLKIFMDSGHQTRLERRLKRDNKERGVSGETIRYQWENHVIPAEKEFLLPYREGVDMIIDNEGQIDEAVYKLINVIKDIVSDIKGH